MDKIRQTSNRAHVIASAKTDAVTVFLHPGETAALAEMAAKQGISTTELALRLLRIGLDRVDPATKNKTRKTKAA